MRPEKGSRLVARALTQEKDTEAQQVGCRRRGGWFQDTGVRRSVSLGAKRESGCVPCRASLGFPTRLVCTRASAVSRRVLPAGSSSSFTPERRGELALWAFLSQRSLAQSPDIFLFQYIPITFGALRHQPKKKIEIPLTEQLLELFRAARHLPFRKRHPLRQQMFFRLCLRFPSGDFRSISTPAEDTGYACTDVRVSPSDTEVTARHATRNEGYHATRTTGQQRMPKRSCIRLCASGLRVGTLHIMRSLTFPLIYGRMHVRR